MLESQNESKIVERNSTIELLRIISMLMIVGCHIVSFIAYNGNDFGGDLYISGNFLNRFFLGMLSAFGRIGVGLFFMISGFFLILRDTVKFYKTIYKTIFYSVVTGIIIIIITITKHNISSEELKEAIRTLILPVTHGHYWFITVYVVLCLLLPSINIFLRKLTEKQYIFLIIFCFFYGNFLGEYIGTLFYTLQRGILFYSLGAYYQLKMKQKKFNIKFLLSFMILILLFFYSFLEMKRMDMLTNWNLLTRNDKIVFYSERFLENTFLEPISTFLIFLIFLNLKMFVSKFINLIAKTTLGVYLLHTSTGFSKFLYENICNIQKYYATKFFVLKSLVSIIIIFSICSLIDIIYIFLIEPVLLRINTKIKGVAL